MVLKFGAAAVLGLILVAGCTVTTRHTVMMTTGHVEPGVNLAPAMPAGLPSEAEFAQGAAALINAERKAAGLKPLAWSPQLAKAAAGHASDMVARTYFAHASPEGTTPGVRVRAQGYKSCRTAENIAWGRKDAAEVVAGWMASPGHRANNLNPDVTHFGVARSGGPTWVAVFAAKC